MDTDMTRDLIALVDMDGTIANYDKQMREDLEQLKAPEEPDYTPVPGVEPPPHIEARMNLIKARPMWFRNLPGYRPGFQIVDMLRKRDFRLVVLTKGPHRTVSAWTEKVAWCRELIPDASVTVTDDKSLTYGAVLVDDFVPYAEAWLKHRPRGLVIMPAHPWNEGFTHPQVVRFTGTPENIQEVAARLDAVVERLQKRS